ncbi:MAG TPA: HYR domain-containing protein [Blastocatellia bacterium]|nr:HYR domain-containing protein [Blastocatellia bacterium]
MIRYRLMSSSKRIPLVLALVLALTSLASFMPSGGQAALIQKKKPPVAPAADGDLDTATFATAGPTPGVARTNLGASHNSRVNALGIQTLSPNAGKIVAGGSDQGGANGINFALTRYSSTGVLDTSFGSSGIAITDFRGSSDQLLDLAITATDKIVAVGSADNPSAPCGFNTNSTDIAVAVYNADGSPDTTFNPCGSAPCGGKKTIDFFGCDDAANAVVIQPDGKIVVAGTAFQYDSMSGNLISYMALARLNTNGMLDNTFGTGGLVSFNTTTNPLLGTPGDIALYTSGPQAGKFIVVGQSATNDFFVARFNSDGSLDNDPMTGFGPTHTGIVTTNFSAVDNARSVVLQSDGKIIAAGVVNHIGNSGTDDFGMARYNVDGSLDDGGAGDTTPGDSFGTGGKVTTDFSGGGALRQDSLSFVGLTSNGKIILVGMSSGDIDMPPNNVALARYNGTDGSLDSGFGTGGKVLNHLGQTAGQDNFPNPVGLHGGALQSDGKILVGGGISTVSGSGVDFFVARFLNTAPDCTLTCPANIIKSNDPNQCGAVATFSNPTESGTTCTGTISCSPTSGSFFPVGTSTVTCMDSSGPSCSFTVTVNDTQPPTITCPPNQTVPGATCQVVNYTTPSVAGGTVSDNCPGATAMCSPPSGTCFNVGTTTVTCTATDAHSNTAMCSFTITVSNCTSITCPANVTQSNDPNQCGATVTYPAPTANGSCGTITCSPASGSFFPKGTTTVTCTSSSGPSCQFTVTVNDTQPPSITCPANVTSVTAQTCPPTGSSVVTYPPPVATDNCPGVTTSCTPASGSTFPIGSTTVTCTATDTSGNTASCSFTVTTFDTCMQDDSNPATVLLFNSQTGDYRFCCGGTVFTGKGKVIVQGCTISLQHVTTDRRVQATVDKASFRGTASLQTPPGVLRCTISDRDIRNNSCKCP